MNGGFVTKNWLAGTMNRVVKIDFTHRIVNALIIGFATVNNWGFIKIYLWSESFVGNFYEKEKL